MVTYFCNLYLVRVLFVELLKPDPGSTEASAGVDNGA